jgi:hypothetical protein
MLTSLLRSGSYSRTPDDVDGRLTGCGMVACGDSFAESRSTPARPEKDARRREQLVPRPVVVRVLGTQNLFHTSFVHHVSYSGLSWQEAPLAIETSLRPDCLCLESL